jgi:hypothetical protein
MAHGTDRSESTLLSQQQGASCVFQLCAPSHKSSATCALDLVDADSPLVNSSAAYPDRPVAAAFVSKNGIAPCTRCKFQKYMLVFT